MNPLAVYWSAHHRRPTDYEYMSRLQPAAVKIMDGGPPDYQWVRHNVPGALVIARDWALSEQKSDMLNNPAGTGRRHAQEWKQKQAHLGFDPANTLVLGINEPEVWDPWVIDALVAYTVAFLDECTALGLRGGALQLSVGWPGNTGPDTPPNWAPYDGVEAAIQRGKHALVLHEYWADEGPREQWGWWCGRFMACPWQVPIIIGECGVDMFVKYGAGFDGNRGWQGQVDAARYAAECAEYVALCQQDPRFFCATPFTTDYAAGEWQSFDTEPAHNELVARAQWLAPAFWFDGALPPDPTPEPEPEPVPGVLVHPLPRGGYTVTQRFNQTYTNPKGHEGTDFGAAGGAPVCAMADGVVAYAGTDPAYGNYVRVFHEPYAAHTFYAHLSRIDVQAGAWVFAGDQLGAVGSTGNSTGSHLHLEVRLGGANDYSAVTPKEWGRIDPESWAALFGLSLATGESVAAPSTVFLPVISS